MKLSQKDRIAEKGEPEYEFVDAVMRTLEVVLEAFPIPIGLTALLNLLVRGFKEYGCSKEELARIVYRAYVSYEKQDEEEEKK